MRLNAMRFQVLFVVLIGLMVALALDSAAFAKDLISQQKFGDRYSKLVKKTYPKMRVKRLDPLGFEFSGSPADGHQAFLDNAYREYQQSPDQLDDILNHYVAFLGENKDTEETKLHRNRIVPIVRSAKYLDVIKELRKGRSATTDNDPIYETIVPGLLLIYALDRPRSIRTINADDLKTLKLSRKDLPDLARSNIRRMIGDKLRLNGSAGVFYVETGGTYESSLLTFSALWDKRAIPVKGDYVVYVPARNVIIITGSEEEKAAELARKTANEIFSEAPRPLFAKPLVRRDGRWALYGRK